MSETLYRKKGRRYVPFSEWERLQGDEYRRGTHLTVCYPGGRLTRYEIKEDRAGLLAALEQHRDVFLDLIRKAMEARPSIKEPLTEKQVKAWRAWEKACGHLYAVQTPAIVEAYDALVAAVHAAESAPVCIDAHQ